MIHVCDDTSSSSMHTRAGEQERGVGMNAGCESVRELAGMAGSRAGDSAGRVAERLTSRTSSSDGSAGVGLGDAKLPVR